MILQDSFVYLAARLVQSTIMFATVVVYTKLLTPAEYGDYALVLSAVSIINALVGQWLYSTALRLAAAADDESAFRSTIFLSFVSMLAVVAVVCAIAFVLLDDANRRRLLLYGLALFSINGFIELNLNLLLARSCSAKFALVSITRAAGSALFGAALAYWGWGASGVLCGAVIGGAIPIMLFLQREIREVNISGFDIGVFRQIVRYGLPLSLGFVLFAIAVNSDRQILASLADVYVVGLYTAAFDIADRIVHVPMVSVGSATFAQTVRQLEKHGPSTTRPQLAENFTLLVAVGLPTAVGLAAVAGEFSGLALGPDFRDAASTIIPVAALASFLSNLRSHYFDHAFQLGRQPQRLLVVMGLLSIAAVGFNLLWIPSFGGVGAACAMLAAHAISLPICALLGRRAFQMPFPARESLLVVVAAVAMGIVVYSIPGGGSTLSLVSKVAAGIVTYFGIVALVLPDVFRKLLIWPRWAKRLK